MAMNILITNDDGMHASQLVPLIRWAQRLGNVTTVVPKIEQSGKSHAIEIHKAFEVKKVELAPDIFAYAVDSTPADCLRFAVLGMKRQFDLVISGINRGLNIGADIMYSGTVSAVCEAVNLGIPAVAFSTEPCCYETAIEHLDRVWDYFETHKLLEQHNLYNVNIPRDAGDIRITCQGGPYYSDDYITMENDMYHPHGKDVFEASDTMDFDTDATLRGRLISISPLTIQRTDMQVYRQLVHLNN